MKESVFPFGRFLGVDTILGPEMKSTGEVMGIDSNFAMAFAKAELAASTDLPLKGQVSVSVRDEDKRELEPIARGLHEMGFGSIATRGTARHIKRPRLPVAKSTRSSEGSPQHCRMHQGGRGRAGHQHA